MIKKLLIGSAILLCSVTSSLADYDSTISDLESRVWELENKLNPRAVCVTMECQYPNINDRIKAYEVMREYHVNTKVRNYKKCYKSIEDLKRNDRRFDNITPEGTCSNGYGVKQHNEAIESINSSIKELKNRR